MAYIGSNPIDVFRGLASYDTFTGDGSTTTFDLSKDAPNGGQNDILVVVNNVIQEPGASKSFTLGVDGSGNFRRVTFNVAPASADEIYVINPGRPTQLLQVSDNTITSAKLNTSAITGQTALTTGVQGADTLLLHDDSASALKKITLDDLITGQTELSAVAADDDVLLVYDTSATEIKKIQKSNLSPTLTYTVGSETGDGSTVAFTINSGRAVANVLVIVNGVVLVPTTDYTIASTTLTFNTAPLSGAEIQIRYLPI